MNSTLNLHPSLIRLAQLQHDSVDRLALQEAAETAVAKHVNNAKGQLKTVAEHLQIPKPRWLRAPDASVMPALIYVRSGSRLGEWGVLRGKNGQGQWISEWWDVQEGRWQEQADTTLAEHDFAVLKLSQPFVASNSPVYQLIRQEVFTHRKLLVEALIGGIVINVIALTTSLYSMQIYDRVVPTGATQTLLVLTLGVVLAVMFELMAKRLRTTIYEELIDKVDQRLARTIYLRFLAIRLDQLPQSVGALAGQMRGYETVRGFFTSVTTSLLIDAPFALIFTLLIALIAGVLAVIPLTFFILSCVIGWHYRKRLENYAGKAMGASNFKTGLLVETVEGAETIKSGQGGWRMLSRWMKTTDDARDYELQMRNISEHSQHLTAAFQQLSYILLVACGALLVSKGELTMGSLIACSILSGRILAPVAMIPNQLMQWAHSKAALQGLDRLWTLQDDHYGQEHPIVIESIRGHYRFENVVASYNGNKALSAPGLQIKPGEKIGVLGPVGAGKTTLLRLLSGMYKPQEGRILLDDVDLSHLAKPVLSEHLGYVQQDGRLFSGTLRDNLILGQLDPGDEIILNAARQTGLLQTVISQHPKGLQQEIFEGGTGLSGGQRQLVNLTRAFLRGPSIWLLDEPTASMDRNLEMQITQLFRQTLKAEDTLVLVTHKNEMLALVDRLIVVANHQIIMDGPKAQILQQLNTPQTKPVPVQEAMN
ncbi:MAG: ATP-binding cassette domain-containing protein [Methylophilaceae bacterium]|nr:MAG: ATP-binding cassette domain-containing protein [Methylophilaceae bacterium]